jgi:hypothetical protein
MEYYSKATDETLKLKAEYEMISIEPSSMNNLLEHHLFHFKAGNKKNFTEKAIFASRVISELVQNQSAETDYNFLLKHAHDSKHLTETTVKKIESIFEESSWQYLKVYRYSGLGHCIFQFRSDSEKAGVIRLLIYFIPDESRPFVTRSVKPEYECSY